ncbi:hypothetical protein [Thermoanaerobacterium sp. RBIITD]|uniref:hypothetical protein n=1 Tax=Thermoanaerobacterium sp. RBIITD TaxID=1550240 RepID=UPI000BB707ED|nr:hypothetical protein SAMN05660242_0785 [Thermoanaerobacterium sp. RBIITD]
MVIFCNKESVENEIMFVYSGYEMNLSIMEGANMQFAGKLNAYIFEDDYDVIMNPGEYRIYLQKTKPKKHIVCKKPVVEWYFDGNKSTIISDGVDYTTIKGIIYGLQNDEKVDEIRLHRELFSTLKNELVHLCQFKPVKKLNMPFLSMLKYFTTGSDVMQSGVFVPDGD